MWKIYGETTTFSVLLLVYDLYLENGRDKGVGEKLSSCEDPLSIDFKTNVRKQKEEYWSLCWQTITVDGGGIKEVLGEELAI